MHKLKTEYNNKIKDRLLKLKTGWQDLEDKKTYKGKGQRLTW